MDRVEGRVVKFKGQWGWINSDDFPDGDIFAHQNDVQGGVLKEGNICTFEIGEDAKTGKPRAKNIKVSRPTPDAERQGDIVLGEVTSWKEPWGWISTDSDGEIFGHREELFDPTALIDVGTLVAFEVGEDKKSGKPRAVRIEITGGTGTGGDRYNGVVTSWKEDWGWIACDEIGEGDVFAHKEDLLPGTILEKGDEVSFALGEDAKGRRRALQIVGRFAGKRKDVLPARMPQLEPGRSLYVPRGMQPPPGRSLYGGRGAQPPPPRRPPPPAFAAHGRRPLDDAKGHSRFMGERLPGEVTSWKGQWGWVDSPEFGGCGELFAHEQEVMGKLPQVGSKVFFTVGTDSKGRMRALDISVGGGGRGGAAGGGSKPLKRKAQNIEKDTSQFEGLEGATLDGQIVSFRDKWGWINSPEFDGDIFGHMEDVVDGSVLSAGQQVTFTLGRDAKSGRWRGMEISVIGPAAKHRRT